ncbi:MAG: carbohydrate-binding domain-containing protein [Bacteroidota bacterium]
MKKTLLLSALLLLSASLFAQDRIFIHRADGISMSVALSRLDSVIFSPDGSRIFIRIDNDLTGYFITGLDSLTFGTGSDTVDIIYSGTTARVINPLAYDGVSAVVDDGDVTITSTAETSDITYRLSGEGSDGMFKIYSEKRFNLVFSNLDLTNTDGPAINVQSGKKATLILEEGSVNSLSDGVNYATPVNGSDGEQEDQDAALFSEGKLLFTGTGNLTIAGMGSDQHAICSDDQIFIENGTITVSSATKDAIHAKDGVEVSGGTITATSSCDGIDGDEGYVFICGGSLTVNESAADAKGISCDSTLTMTGGTVSVVHSGNQSKGIRSGQAMLLSGGTLTVRSSGNAVLEASGSGYDPSYCTALKSDAGITIDGATVTITCTGASGKGISSETSICMTGGSLNVSTSGNGTTYTNSSGTRDSYHGSCLSSNGNILLSAGTATLTASGAGSKGISADGTLNIGTIYSSPVVNVTTTGTKITITSGSSGGPPGSQTTGDYDESKAITCDGAITIDNGNITVSSADDGIKSETSVTISTATLSITKSTEAIESAAITVNSGTVSLVASDDGFNATKGSGGEADDGSQLNLKGGIIMVNASGGDGIDSNGAFTMTGGTVLVHGPQSSPEVGMDVNGTKNVNGGLLIISGTNSNNTEAPGTTSSQYSVQAMSSTSFAAGTLFHVADSDGNYIFTFKPVRSYYSMVFSSPALASGKSYSIYTGGNSTGTSTGGLITGGSYSGGTLKKTFTISGKLTNVSF